MGGLNDDEINTADLDGGEALLPTVPWRRAFEECQCIVMTPAQLVKAFSPKSSSSRSSCPPNDLLTPS